MAATNNGRAKWFSGVVKNVVSLIKIDEKHYVMVFFFSVSEESGLTRWNVSYFCNDSGEKMLHEFRNITKAKSKAFELSNRKCPACYDENGVRRKQINHN